jgi:hypothetical protein
MTTLKPNHGRKGFLLLEAVLSIALFAIFLGAFGITIYEGQGQTKAGGDRKRAVNLATEAIEGTRSIAAKSYSSLSAGVHGVVISAATGQWSFQGTSTTATGGYTTSVTVSALSGDRALVKAVTTWNRSPNRPQSLTMYTILGNWRTTKPTGNWGGASLTPVGTYTYNYSASDPAFSDVAVTGSSAFLTTTNATEPGLIIVNLPHLTSPTYAGQVNIGGVGYALAIKGQVLYVLTSASTAEIKAYDISTPAAPTLLATYDLPGSGAARAIAVAGDFLYVGATGLGPATSLPTIRNKTIAASPWRPAIRGWLTPAAHAAYCYVIEIGGGSVSYCCKTTELRGGLCPSDPNYPSSSSAASSVASSAASSSSVGAYPNGNDFFSFDISSSSQIRYLHSLYVGGVKGISVFGTAAFLATTVDGSELEVVNVTHPDALVAVGTRAGGSTRDGLSTAVGPSTLLLGEENTAAPANGNGTTRIFDLQNPGMPSSLVGPWDYTSSGSTVRVTTDPTACYAFIASNWYPQSLQIVKINPASSSTLLQSFSPAAYDGYAGESGYATSVFHAPGSDRLFLTTSKRLFIFAPAAGSSACP